MKAITSGTTIINHAIKNNTGKIKLYCENIRQYAKATVQTELVEDIETIEETSNQIHEMIYKIHDQTQDMILQKVRVKMTELIEQVTGHYKLNFENIEVSKEYLTEVEVLCDKVHVREVFSNLFLNAVESMPKGGALLIKLFETKKNVVIEVTDTGCGIKKEHLKQVFDPFFTTKLGSKSNFGLGLSYCYNVIKKHGGRMEIHSKEGVGTTIYLNFIKYAAIK